MWRREEVPAFGMVLAPPGPISLPGESARAKTKVPLEHAPLLLPVLSVDEIAGRGTMVSGLIEQGTLTIGDKLEIVGLRATRPVVVSGFHLPPPRARKPAAWSAVFWPARAQDVEPGMVLAAPGSIGAHTEIEAELTVAGPEPPTFVVILDGSRVQFHIWERDVPCEVHLPPGMQYVMPGERRAVGITLFMPLALEAGHEFSIRVSGETVGAGRVSAYTDGRLLRQPARPMPKPRPFAFWKATATR